ncbi:MAG: hydroxyacid dehydrogenase [Candidatus Njordarchaeia archaeon]
MLKILITDPTDSSAISFLEKEGFHVDYAPGISKEELLGKIEAYDILLVRGRTKVNKELLEKAKNLKLVGRIGVGLDNIDLEETKKRGIKVVNSGDATADSVAELTIGSMIALLRKIHIGDELFRRGVWGKDVCLGHQLNGKTLGIIGFGNIGRRVGKIALALGMKVLAFDVIEDLVKKSGLDVQFASLDEIYKESDIITVHVPLLKQTKGMISKNEIQKMKNGVILVNTARVEIFDLEAVIEGLESGKIGGVIIDSGYKPDNPLMRKLMGHPNVLITPHIGAQTYEAQKRAVMVIAEYIVKKFKG